MTLIGIPYPKWDGRRYIQKAILVIVLMPNLGQ